MKLKNLSVFFVFTLVFCLIMLSSVGAENYQEVTISIASPFEAEHIFVEAAEHFKERVETESDGAIEVNIYPGGVMGGEEEISEQVSFAAVDMSFMGVTNIEYFAADYSDIFTPFLLTSWDHLEKILDSPLGDEINESMIDSGDTRVLSPMYRGIRHLTSDTPVESVEDVEGLTLRLPGLENWILPWEELGAETTPVPMDELYTALATGVAEASEGEFEQIWTNRLFEVQDYVVLTGHMMAPGFISINNSVLEGFNTSTKNLIIEAAEESGYWTLQASQERESELKKQIEEEGVKFIEVDREKFISNAMPAIEKMLEENETLSLEDIEKYR